MCGCDVPLGVVCRTAEGDANDERYKFKMYMQGTQLEGVQQNLSEANYKIRDVSHADVCMCVCVCVCVCVCAVLQGCCAACTCLPCYVCAC